MSKIYKTGHRKFAIEFLKLYTRTHTYILDRVKVFCIIVGNLLKICIFVSTITKKTKHYDN